MSRKSKDSGHDGGELIPFPDRSPNNESDSDLDPWNSQGLQKLRDQLDHLAQSDTVYNPKLRILNFFKSFFGRHERTKPGLHAVKDENDKDDAR